MEHCVIDHERCKEKYFYHPMNAVYTSGIVEEKVRIEGLLWVKKL